MEKLAIIRMYKGSPSQSQKLCIAWCIDSLAQRASTDVLGIVLGSGETEMNNTLLGVGERNSRSSPLGEGG